MTIRRLHRSSRTPILNPHLGIRGGRGKILTKLTTKSDGVRGLSFHCKRPWILASLHNGVIELWDYRMGVLIDRFEEHYGPVRGIHFHKSEPLFVSGGDDHKIKVWNYKMHRCLFTLLGHGDYIRTVQFHHEYPWIVSASDDQTIKIWDWHSHTCISVLRGHAHHVMCASFHPKEHLVVSASLDGTVRVWDLGSLRMKKEMPRDEDSLLKKQIKDLLGVYDPFVKSILEGHNNGVNWAAFHPSKPIIVSGADDHQIKLWLMNDTAAWEAGRLRGDMGRVSCVLYHAKQDIIVSSSFDGSISVWDVGKLTVVRSFRREHGQFRTLAAHPETNLLAAGHDSGMIVFKLERDRPAFCVSRDSIYYFKDHYLWLYEFSTERDNYVIPIRRTDPTSLNQCPRTLSYSPTDNAILLSFDVDGGSYELYIVPKDIIGSSEYVGEAKRGAGESAVFVARNRFAVLDKTSNQVLVKNLKNKIVTRIDLPVVADAIFYAGRGNLLCGADDRLVLFDLQQRIVLGDLQTPSVKNVVWSNDMETVALISKHAIVIASKTLVHRCTLNETIRIKSGAWDDNGVFIYTTLVHVKYCLPNGDNGIIRSLDFQIYITKVSGSTLYYLDRDRKNHAMTIDTAEYVLKLSLIRKRYDHVASMIRSSRLCGQALVAYLQRKGFPEVALHFAKDARTRFSCALESGNIQIAVASATEIDEEDHWYRLGIEALRQGNAGIVEFAYQKTKKFDRLSFLYLVTGNKEKLSKMLSIAEIRNDVMSRFHNALYLGDIRERIRILESAGYLPLAYVTATVHGLADVADRLAAELGRNVPCLPEGRVSSLLIPPAPILRGGDWPLTGTVEGGLDNIYRTGQEEDEEVVDGDQGEGLDITQNGDKEGIVEKWDLDDLGLSPEADASTSVFVAPSPGMQASQIWTMSSLAGEHAAAGSCDTAARLLSEQLGIKNFGPLKPLLMDLHLGSHTYLHALASAPVMSIAVAQGRGVSTSCLIEGQPLLPLTLSRLGEKLEMAYRAATEGNILDALQLFVTILHTIPLIVVDKRWEVDEVKELIRTAREYVLGLRMLAMRRELRDDAVRQLELAAYFTACKLRIDHRRSVLWSAMILCFKWGNYNTSANFARQLLETNTTDEELLKRAKQILRACIDRNMTDAYRLNYDFGNPFVVCGATFLPIYRGKKSVPCPYCGSRFVPAIEGHLCVICDLAEVGADASGLRCCLSHR